MGGGKSKIPEHVRFQVRNISTQKDIMTEFTLDTNDYSNNAAWVLRAIIELQK
jgi:hypothetical protein